jgi:hypothetical protein
MKRLYLKPSLIVCSLRVSHLLTTSEQYQVNEYQNGDDGSYSSSIEEYDDY